jgi:hypothetical protein
MDGDGNTHTHAWLYKENHFFILWRLYHRVNALYFSLVPLEMDLAIEHPKWYQQCSLFPIVISCSPSFFSFPIYNLFSISIVFKIISWFLRIWVNNKLILWYK